MNLKHLTDHILLQDTKRLVSEERRLTTQILHHLKEIDRRRLYSDIKYGSLFEYCVKELGYSESSAQRRIGASRLLRDLPQIEKKINEGTLTLSNLTVADRFFKNSKISNIEEKAEILKQVEGMTFRECEKKLFEVTMTDKKSKESETRINQGQTKITIILSNETMTLLNEVRASFNKILSMDELISFLAFETLTCLKKKKFKLSQKSLVSRPTLNMNLKNISNFTKREVYSRDQKCTNCGSFHRLNFDHRVPKALGGSHSAENIRLLCFNCNQRARIRARL